jgi:glutamate synthase (NADPH/NADH) small chain
MVEKDLKRFLKVKRAKTEYRPVCERVQDYNQVFPLRPDMKSQEQASRCMDCGTPFCHWGCPVGNYIPEWNDLMLSGRWDEARELLAATNNLPEITGRVCPAPCEFACVLGINDDPVTVRENELAIVEHAFDSGLIKANPPKKRTGKKIAVIGSGPAGLACAAQLNQAGHNVTVFERDEKIGGIMSYGIPDFKLEKKILDRRIKIWQEEGIEFKPGSAALKRPAGFDAVVLAGGSKIPRDLPIPGRELKGVYFAMEYLTQSNHRVAGAKVPADQVIDAKGKKVVVIGGGDTGSDCVGTAVRQGADCVVQIELMPRPGEERPAHQPWPLYPMLLKTTSSHEEGGDRHWSVLTKEFKSQNPASPAGGSKVKSLVCVKVDEKLKEIPGTEFEIPADLVLLAMGFIGAEKTGLLADLGVEFDQRGNVKTGEDYMTSIKGVFAAGDLRRGQSLIVWAISEGRRAARAVDLFLMGRSDLPVV